MKKSNEQQTARDLFFQTDHSQAEIARQVGVDPKTVNLWVKNGKWKEVKLAARRSPAILVEQYFGQLAALNNAIAARADGCQYPTLHEAETMRKLIVCINNVQKQVSLGASIDVMQNLIYRIAIRDNELANKVTDYAEEVLKSREMNGIRSHEVAYDWGEGDNSPLEGGRSEATDVAPEQGDVGTPDKNNSPLEGGRSDATYVAPEQGDVGTHDSQSLVEDQADNRQYIGNEQALDEPQNMAPSPLEKEGMTQNTPEDYYPPKCTRDPNDPYTFYYHKITRRKFGSPKYGLPPDGFREVPWKPCVEIHHGKGFCRY